MVAQPFRLFQPDADPPAVVGPTPRQLAGAVKRRKRRLLVSELVPRYLQHCKATGKHGPLRQAECKRVLGMFQEKFGLLACEEVPPYMLTDWIEENAQWSKSSTRLQVVSMVKACFNWAAEGKRIRFHNLAAVTYEEGERGPQLTDDVFFKLCRLASKSQELAFRFLRLSGRRIHEACAADVGHFDLDRSQWNCWIYKGTRGKRGKKPQKVELVPELVELLRRAWEDRGNPGPNEPALINSRGRRLNQHVVRQNLYNLKDRLGLSDVPGCLHGIRHRYATAAIVNGAPPKLVAQNLGHASVNTTEKYYVDVSNESEALQAAARLAAPKEQ